ncbi:sensor domain-containing diguanylate cyclase [Paraferrimonas sp. SM1919]|uniref:bifunctional diguanylate cyclase/phosphodiesterase n=1 Tax=Paraferrimonas sp. SM1919 TaxID=2662263 RepID=UPI0013D1B75E|nr:sensor domain-containing diguanylate cyclase [Paraferrimonas sp. SM1919]
MFSQYNHKDLKDSVNSIGTPLVIFEHDQNSVFKLVSCNDLFSEVVGDEVNSIVAKSLQDIFPRYLANQVLTGLNKSLINQSSTELEVTINRLGKNRWWKCLITPLIKHNDSNPRLMATLIEITEKKLLSKELKKADSRVKAIVTSAYDGIISIDTNEKILLANEAASEIFGSNDLIGQHISSLIPAKYREKHSGYVQSFRGSDVPSRPMHLRAAVMGVKANGEQVPLEITIAKINVEGETEMTAVIRDITEKNALIHELNHISMTDELTGLHNRRYLEPLLAQEFERAKHYHNKLSLLFIDIDSFTEFNNNYGHIVGDEILKKVATTIKNDLTEIDTACRWGGEEFVILLPEVDINEAMAIAEKIRLSVAKTEVDYEGIGLRVTISIGVSTLSTIHQTPAQLVSQADSAMLDAKQLGRNKVVTHADLKGLF